MESKTTPKEERGSVLVAKKAYRTPALVVYGKLVELTAAGSGQSNEAHANITSNSYKISH